MVLLGEAAQEQIVHEFAQQLTLCTRIDQVDVREIEYDRNRENLVNYDIKVMIRN